MNLTVWRASILWVLLAAPSLAGERLPGHLPEVRYHLTARPWRPLGVSGAEYLDRVEGVVRFTARHQNEDGAILDPVTHKEQQYATPYYAHALGTLLTAGRAKDLLPSGIRAMEWATRCFETNRTDGHRVFYITPLVESLDLYAPWVPPGNVATWRGRLKAAVAPKEASDNNWSTYLMKGQWLRAKAGLIARDAAVEVIESPLERRAEIADRRHAVEPVPRSHQQARHAGRGSCGAGQSPGPGRRQVMTALRPRKSSAPSKPAPGPRSSCRTPPDKCPATGGPTTMFGATWGTCWPSR